MKKNIQLKFAVFIPFFNNGDTILDTLKSIDDSICFTKNKIDCYVVDDCSKEDVHSILSETKYNAINLIVNRNDNNLGERATINKYFELIRGSYDWVLLVHADDVVKLDWFSDLYKVIQKANQNEVITVWSSYDVFNLKTKLITSGENQGDILIGKSSLRKAVDQILKISAGYHVSGCALNLSLYENNPFDENYPQYGDSLFLIDATLKGYYDVYIRKSLTVYTVNGESVSSVSFHTNRDLMEIYNIYGRYRHLLTFRNKLIYLCKTFYIAMRRMFKAIMLRRFSFAVNTIIVFLKFVNKVMSSNGKENFIFTNN